MNLLRVYFHRAVPVRARTTLHLCRAAVMTAKCCCQTLSRALSHWCAICPLARLFFARCIIGTSVSYATDNSVRSNGEDNIIPYETETLFVNLALRSSVSD